MVPVGRWSPAGSLAEARGEYTLTRLPDGRILAAGGLGIGPRGSLSSTELYEPTSGRWIAGPPLRRPRSSHGAVVLPDGRVLIFGGKRVDLSSGAGSSVDLVECEVLDPTAGASHPTGPLALPMPEVVSAGLLADGTVLAVGGMHLGQPHIEVFDPARGSWSPTEPPRFLGHTVNAGVIPGVGLVLFGGVEYKKSLLQGSLRMGGGGTSARAVRVERSGLLAASQGPWRYGENPVQDLLISPVAAPLGPDLLVLEQQRTTLVRGASGEVTEASNSLATRGPTSTLTSLDAERLLAVGGEGGSAGSAEVFERSRGGWVPAIPPPASLAEHRAVALGDGRALVVGGRQASADGFPAYSGAALIFER
jgi:hypothetical protein